MSPSVSKIPCLSTRLCSGSLAPSLRTIYTFFFFATMLDIHMSPNLSQVFTRLVTLLRQTNCTKNVVLRGRTHSYLNFLFGAGMYVNQYRHSV